VGRLSHRITAQTGIQQSTTRQKRHNPAFYIRTMRRAVRAKQAGTAYMSLEARLTENVPIDGPTYADRFHFKFMHAANGRGLEFDPILVHAHFTS